MPIRLIGSAEKPEILPVSLHDNVQNSQESLKVRCQLNQLIIILIVSEYFATLNFTDDDVTQYTRRVKTG